MNPLELQWHNAIRRYTSTVQLGGTVDERRFAWKQAAHALDTWLLNEQAQRKTRAEHQTEELEAA
jgi:hypothetical protein